MIVFPVRLLHVSNSSKQNKHKTKCVYNKRRYTRISFKLQSGEISTTDFEKKNISWLPQNTYTEQTERRAAPHHRALQEGSSIMTVGVETRVRRGDERRINKPPGLNLKNNKQLRTVKLDRWNLRLLFHWRSTAWKYFFMGN